MRSNSKVRTSIILAFLMVMSTLLNPAVAQSDDFEFSTRGDILFLNSENREIISVDHEALASSGDLDFATQSVTSLRLAHDATPVSLAHDQYNLLIGYDDGVVEIYAKQDGDSPFTHWKRSHSLSLPTGHYATSLSIDSYMLYWTSNKDAVLRSNSMSALDNAPTSWIEDRSLSNSTAATNLRAVAIFESGNLTSPSTGFFAIEDDGGIGISGKKSPEMNGFDTNNRIPITRNTGTIRGTAISAIAHLDTPENGANSGSFMIADDQGIRLVQMGPSVTATHVYTKEAGFEAANMNENPPLAGARISRGESMLSSTLNFPQNSAGASQRCFPLVIDFAQVPEFTSDGARGEASTISLSIGGITKILRHVDVSGKRIVWEPEADADSLTPKRCELLPGALQLEIVDSDPKDLDATVIIEEYGPTNGITWRTGKNYRGTSLYNDSTHVLGMESLFGINNFRSTTHPEVWRGIAGISMLPIVSEGFWDWVTTINSLDEEVALGNVRPIQSVFDPSLYMQGKNMWWEATVDYDKLPGGIVMDFRETVEIELLLRGVQCWENGVWCAEEWRTADTWEPLVMRPMLIGSPTTPTERVTVLRFEVDIDDAEDGVVLPFDDGDVDSHMTWELWPAPPSSSRYLSASTWNGIERGKVEWKVVVDPDHKLREDSTKYGNNDDSGTEYSVEWEEEDNFNILVIPTTTKFRHCSEWDWWYWNDCQSRWTSTEDVWGDGFDADDFQNQIEMAEEKMQQMFPIPEGKLHYQLHSTGIDMTWTEGETINDWLGRRIQLTLMFLDVIDVGVNGVEDSDWDRIIMLTANDFANTDVPLYKRHSGFMTYGGIAPCSTAAIVTNHNNDQDNADTMIHELGHTFLVGHDNVGFGDHTFNNCGHPSIYDPDVRATGWSPTSPGVSDTGRYWDGESFMRYESDGAAFDGSGHDWCDYEFNGDISGDGCGNGEGNWIQRDDYRFAMGEFNRDVGDHYLDDWLGYALWNTGAAIWDFIVDMIVDAIDWGVSIIEAVLDFFAWMFDEISDWAVGRSASQNIELHSAILKDTVNGNLHFGGGSVIPSSSTEGLDDCVNCWGVGQGDEPTLWFKQLDENGNVLQTARKVLSECGPQSEVQTGCMGMTDGFEMLSFNIRSALHPDARSWIVENADGEEIGAGNIPLSSDDVLSFNPLSDTYNQGDVIPLSWNKMSSVVDNGTDYTYEVSMTDPSGMKLPIAIIDDGDDSDDDSFDFDTSTLAPGEYTFTLVGSNGFVTTTPATATIIVDGSPDIVLDWISTDHAGPGDRVQFIIDHGVDRLASECTISIGGVNSTKLGAEGSRTLHEIRLATEGHERDSIKIESSCGGEGTRMTSSYPRISIIRDNHAKMSEVGEIISDSGGSGHGSPMTHEQPIFDMTDSSLWASEMEESMIMRLKPRMDLDRDGVIDSLEVCMRDGDDYVWHDGWENNFDAVALREAGLATDAGQQRENVLDTICIQSGLIFRDLDPQDIVDKDDDPMSVWQRGNADVLASIIGYEVEKNAETKEGDSEASAEDAGIVGGNEVILILSALVLGAMLGFAIASQRRSDEDEVD